jgi:hypothetical protein
MAKAEVGVLILLAAVMLVLGVGISSVYFISNPRVIIEKVPFPVPGETKLVNVSVPVIQEVPIEVIKEIKISDERIPLIESYLEDIDEDLSIEYLVFEEKAKVESEDLIQSKMIEILDDEDFFDSVLDDYRKSEVQVYKIYDAEILSRDYEDFDIELKYEVKVKAKEDGEDREYFMFNVTVPFEDAELVFDDIEVIEG